MSTRKWITHSIAFTLVEALGILNATIAVWSGSFIVHDAVSKWNKGEEIGFYTALQLVMPLLMLCAAIYFIYSGLKLYLNPPGKNAPGKAMEHGYYEMWTLGRNDILGKSSALDQILVNVLLDRKNLQPETFANAWKQAVEEIRHVNFPLQEVLDANAQFEDVVRILFAPYLIEKVMTFWRKQS